MRPPRTRVWLLRRTTEVSASRLVKRGELMGGGSGVPTSLTSCLTSRATVPCSPMRGVTVRMMPASLYSTVWVMELAVPPPEATGTCWLVTMGTEVETLMMAFLFSLVMMDGLDDFAGQPWHPGQHGEDRRRRGRRAQPAGREPARRLRRHTGLRGLDSRAAGPSVDGVERGREILGLGVLDEVDEDALAAID